MQHAEPASSANELVHGSCTTRGVTLHFVEAGRGPLVVLLHGFPEFWYAFRHQLQGLAAAGYRVIAPDLRGYNLSSKPRGVSRYGLVHLVDDVAALIENAGERRAHVVGHDWGGGIAWAFAMRHPDSLHKLVVLNCPHPQRLARGLLRPSQLAKSWYFFFFQLPGVPEWLLARKRYELLIASLRDELAVPSALSEADFERYREAYAQPFAMTAMLNYYRAMLRLRGVVRWRRVTAPVLVLWGARDRHLEARLAAPPPRWVPHAELEMFDDASHWLHHEQPQRVNARLLEFFSR